MVGWLRLLTLASAPASSRLGRLHPAASLALLAGSAVAAFSVPGGYAAVAAAAAALASAVVRGLRVTAASLAAASPFLLTYAALSLAVQALVNTPGCLNPAWTLTTSLRLLALTLASTTVASVTSVYDVIRLLSRASPTFAVLAALSIKLTYVLSHVLGELLTAYSVNLPGRGLRAAALRVRAVAAAVAYCSAGFALQTSEVLPPILKGGVGRRRSFHFRR